MRRTAKSGSPYLDPRIQGTPAPSPTPAPWDDGTSQCKWSGLPWLHPKELAQLLKCLFTSPMVITTWPKGAGARGRMLGGPCIKESTE